MRALHESPDAFGSTFAREAERSDADWALRLSRGCTSPWDLPLIAEVDGKASGLAWARIEDGEPTIARLYQVWVAPERRQLGLGRALLDAAIEWARSRGAHTVVLNVTAGSSPAMRLYQRAGFVPIGELKPLRPGSALLSQSMQLSLTSSSGQRSA
ncbi:MAG: GNAT family N-acetyltransferase [Gemmatimonadaceae bacterium]